MLRKELSIKRVKESKRQELMEEVYKLGMEYEQTREYCAQCVVAALEKVLEIKDKGIFQASYPLTGGLADTTQGTCGALSGGAMILGYLYGRSEEEFEQNVSNNRATDLVKKLYDRSIKEYGSCLCKGVQKSIFGRSFDFWNEEDNKAFEQAGGHKDKCPTVVARLAAWTVEIIWDEENK